MFKATTEPMLPKKVKKEYVISYLPKSLFFKKEKSILLVSFSNLLRYKNMPTSARTKKDTNNQIALNSVDFQRTKLIKAITIPILGKTFSKILGTTMRFSMEIYLDKS